MPRVAAAVLLLLLVAVSTSKAQTASSSATSTASAPARDTTAVGYAQAAVQAMGGSATVTAIQDCTVQGTIQVFQSDGSSISGPFTWQWAGGEERYENPGPAGTTTLFLSNHGSPISVFNGKVRRLHGHVLKSMFPPYLPALALTKALTNAQYSIRVIGLTTVGGKQAIQVQLQLPSDALTASLTQQDWYLDAATGLPLRVEYQAPDNDRPDLLSSAATEFGNWQMISGVWVPFQMKFYLDGQADSVATVTSASFNSGVSPTVFNAPVGGAQ